MRDLITSRRIEKNEAFYKPLGRGDKSGFLSDPGEMRQMRVHIYPWGSETNEGSYKSLGK